MMILLCVVFIVSQNNMYFKHKYVKSLKSDNIIKSMKL